LHLLDGLPAAATTCKDPFDLPPEQRDVIIEHIAQRVAQHRVSGIAALVLEMMKPVSFLASQGTVLAAPLFYPFAGEQKLNTVSAFLADRDNVERLLQRVLAEDDSEDGKATESETSDVDDKAETGA